MVCDSCKNEVDRYKRRMTRSGMKTICRSCENPRVRPSAFDPFAELVLDHVRDSEDHAVRITSLRQLRQVEKEHHCVSLVANSDEAHFDDPPQQRQPTAFAEMDRPYQDADGTWQQSHWLHPEIGPQMYEEMRRSGEIFEVK